MSIALNSIDCPCLTTDCLNNLIDKYSIHTTNDFLLWLFNSTEKEKYFSSKTIECIQSCIIASTARIDYREISKKKTYRLNYPLFDHENLLENKRHLIFIYEDFNQMQWNDFFNVLLIRLFIENNPIRIKYINTNISLFDVKYFDSNYFHLNDLFAKFFYFDHYFDLETFENELTLLETNSESIDLLIIDDLFSLIKPYLNLDRRIKTKILQLTYRLNRLAQKQSILVLTGIIFNRKKCEYDSFHADRYILFQSLTKDISIRINNEKSFKLDLDDWKKSMSNSFII